MGPIKHSRSKSPVASPLEDAQADSVEEEIITPAPAPWAPLYRTESTRPPMLFAPVRPGVPSPDIGAQLAAEEKALSGEPVEAVEEAHAGGGSSSTGTARKATVGSKHRGWMITAFTPNAFDWTKAPATLSYLIYQHEIAPTTRGHHMQAFAYFKNAIAMRSVKEVCATCGWPEPHVEAVRGKIEDAKKYCSKEETRAPGCHPIELGTQPEQGKPSTFWCYID